MSETFMREAAVAEREAARGPATFAPNVRRIATVTGKIGSRHDAVDLGKLSKADLEETARSLAATRKVPRERSAFPLRESDELGWLAADFDPRGGEDAAPDDVEGVTMADRRLPKQACDETKWAMMYYTRHGCTNPFSSTVGKA